MLATRIAAVAATLAVGASMSIAGMNAKAPVAGTRVASSGLELPRQSPRSSAVPSPGVHGSCVARGGCANGPLSGTGVPRTVHSATAAAGNGPLIKPPLRGLLVSMWYPGVSKSVAQLGGYIVGIPWSQVQPALGGPVITTSIDYVLRQARATHKRIKLRVTAGVDAPTWAKTIGGPPVPVYDPQSGVGGTVGRFWTPAFGAAYDQLQSKLAAKYDGDPAVAEVVVDRCTTVFPEPFLRQAASAATVRSLLVAGYSVAADKLCQQQQVDAHQVWRTTPSGLAFNPYDSIASNGSVSADEAYTEQMMGYCRTALGSRCVLENDSIRWPSLSFGYASMYHRMAAMGGDVCFQTAGASRVGDVLRTLGWAHGETASAVEIAEPMPRVTLAQMVSAFR